MAIVEYARKQSEYCLDPNYKINLSDVIRYAYPKTGDELVRYVRLRKDKFALPDVSEETLEEHEYSQDELEPESIEDLKESVKKVKLKPIKVKSTISTQVLVGIGNDGVKVYETIWRDEEGNRVPPPLQEVKTKVTKATTANTNWINNTGYEVRFNDFEGNPRESLYQKLIRDRPNQIAQELKPKKATRRKTEELVDKVEEERNLPR